MQKAVLSSILVVWIFALGSAAHCCLAARMVGRTLNDVARALCETVAGEQPLSARHGMTAKDWCAIRENLDPFIEFVTGATQDPEIKAGFEKNE